MKKIIALLLAVLTLLGGCGAPADTTAPEETDAPVTNAPVTNVPVTDAPVTDAPETEPPVPREDYTVAVKDDTYVLNKDTAGDQSNTNYGSESEIQVKTYPGSSATRYGYLKFDISELAIDSGITAVELDIRLNGKQNSNTASLEVYGANPQGWEEDTLTFATQPTVYGLIASRNDIDKNNTTYSFPITAYVKKAIENGQTEIAICLKEASEAEPLLLKFASKESDKSAPALSVYHGTKTDGSVYEGATGVAVLKPSEHGLDSLIGLHRVNLGRIEIMEDTYVEAGSSAAKNFGSSNLLDFKAQVGKNANEFYRITLLKFDISSVLDIDFTTAYLELYCNFKEKEELSTQVNVYGCYPYDWDEMSVTYNTIPEKEDLVTTVTVTGKGIVRVDISDYLRKCANRKDQYISFYLEGDQNSVHRLKFYSKESTAYSPFIIVGNESAPVHTALTYTDVNPWEYAMENVSDWMNRWEIIKQGGDNDAEMIERIDAEYSLTVDAAQNQETDGYNTQYTARPTRTLDTLIGYTSTVDNPSMLDIYGGFMDESMRQEATGFFYTKKIGDRWWTIDPLGYPYFRVALGQITMGNTKQRAALLEQYPTSSIWAQETTDWLFELGFNSAGGWSSTDLLSDTENPLSQTGVLYILKNYCNSKGLDVTDGGGTGLLYHVFPVFDPEFSEWSINAVKSGVKGYENASFIYGWMSDNELPMELVMLDYTLGLDPNDERFVYSYATAWTFMYLKTGKTDLSLDDVTDELRREYRAMVYDRYFKIVSDAFERVVPQHQYMGCRLLTDLAKDEYVLRVAGYWCDLITYNCYRAWEVDPELVYNQQRWAGKPFVITEWYAKGMDVWEKDNRMLNTAGAGWTVRTQEERGIFYENFALQLLECNGCVGFDWFKYRDNDPEDPTADASNTNSNKGILDNDANVYTELVEHMDRFNNQKYSLIEFFSKR